MDSTNTEILFALIKIFLGFIACSVLCAFGAYTTLIGVAILSNSIIWDGDLEKGMPVFLVGILLSFFSFPIGSWLLYSSLQRITPDWLFPNTLIIIFNLSPIFLLLCYLLIFRYRRKQYLLEDKQNYNSK